MNAPDRSPTRPPDRAARGAGAARPGDADTPAGDRVGAVLHEVAQALQALARSPRRSRAVDLNSLPLDDAERAALRRRAAAAGADRGRPRAAAAAGAPRALRQLELPPQAIFSTLGRTAARTIEAKVFADQMPNWLEQLRANIRAGDLSVQNATLWEPRTWPREAKGVGFMEAPRGALTHYVVIKDGLIDNYPAVVPSTWNAGPRDAKGQPGPYEAALMDRHPCTTAGSRSRSSARSTASTRASPARYTLSTRRARS